MCSWAEAARAWSLSHSAALIRTPLMSSVLSDACASAMVATFVGGMYATAAGGVYMLIQNAQRARLEGGRQQQQARMRYQQQQAAGYGYGQPGYGMPRGGQRYGGGGGGYAKYD